MVMGGMGQGKDRTTSNEQRETNNGRRGNSQVSGGAGGNGGRWRGLRLTGDMELRSTVRQRRLRVRGWTGQASQWVDPTGKS
jgi:hypothetical protein